MNKKFKLFGLLAAMTLALPGCKGGKDTTPSQSVTPSVVIISDIEVNNPEDDIVVGDVIDLDTYITVVGENNDPKAYDVEVKSVSTDVVDLEGHTITVKAEGPISLVISAGDESSFVNWESISAVKAAYKAATGDIAYNYGLFDVEATEEGLATTGDFLIHNEEYYYQSYTSKGVRVGEGAAVLHDGYTYSFTCDGTVDCGDLEFTAEGKETAAYWQYYFINMGFGPTYDQFDTISTEDGDYLAITPDKAAPSGMEDYAANLADYIALLTWGNSAYLLASRYGYPFDASSVAFYVEPVGDSYLLTATVDGSEGGAYEGVTLALGQSVLVPDIHITAIEDYIAAETYPEAITFDEITDFVDTIGTCSSYTQFTQSYAVAKDGSVLDNDGTNVTCSTITGYDEANKVFFTKVYTDTGFSTLSDIYGYFENEGKVYTVEVSAEGNLFATEISYAWEVVIAAVSAKGLATAGTSGLTGTGRTIDEDNGITQVKVADTSSDVAFAAALFTVIPYGSTYKQYLTGSGASYTNNMEMTWTFMEGIDAAVSFNVPLNFGTFSPSVAVTFQNVNNTSLASIKAQFVSLIPADDTAII